MVPSWRRFNRPPTCRNSFSTVASDGISIVPPSSVKRETNMPESSVTVPEPMMASSELRDVAAGPLRRVAPVAGGAVPFARAAAIGRARVAGLACRDRSARRDLRGGAVSPPARCCAIAVSGASHAPSAKPRLARRARHGIA
jgi:hypothetical protein